MSMDNLHTSGPTPEGPGSSGWSLKKLTIEDLGALVDYVKKFWSVAVAGVAALYLGAGYFATSSAVKRVECQAKARAVGSTQEAAVVVLNSDLANSIKAQKTLVELKMLVLQVQSASTRDTVDLRPVIDRLTQLIDKEAAEESEKKQTLQSATRALDELRQQVDKCEG